MAMDELNKMGLPAICIDARHAKAALKLQINKSDRNDAVGIARIMQCGWYKEVRVKDFDSHAIKALLVSRALLVKIKRDRSAGFSRISGRHRPGKDERVFRARRGASRGSARTHCCS